MKTTPEMIAQMEAPITKYERSDSTEKRCVAAAFRLLIADLEKARCRIHDLETICDPAGLTIENALSKDQIAALQIMYRKAADELADVRKQLEEATATRGNGVLVPSPKLKEMQAEIRALRKQLTEAQALLVSGADLLGKVAMNAVDDFVCASGQKYADLMRQADSSALQSSIAEAVEPYRKDAERWKELLSRLGDDSGPTIVKIEGWSDEYPGYAWFADLTQEQVIAELDTAIAAKGETNEQTT